jgi:cell division protein ZapA
LADVRFSINGKLYSVECGQGQEERVRAIAALIDMKAQELYAQFGDVDNETLLLMVSILAFTELEKARSSLKSANAASEEVMTEAILNVAKKVRKLAEDLKDGA